MKKIVLLLIAVTLIIATAMMFNSCSQWDTAYEKIDKDGEAVSVRYLANGGMFMETAGVTLVDVYPLDQLKTDSDGNKILSLISPDDDCRPSSSGTKKTNIITHTDVEKYTFAGWYVVETDDDGNPVLDENGNYKLIKEWDFEKDVITLDPDKEYSSKTPTLTLAAAWVPFYQFEFYYQNDSGEWVQIPNSTINNVKTLLFPKWDTDTGKLKLNNYPTVKNKTFVKAYEDPEMTVEITGDLTLGTSLDAERVKKIYTTWEDGDWYRIYTANQLTKINDYKGNYILMADLDFTNQKWGTSFLNYEFKGTLISDKAAGLEGGEDRTIKNVTVTTKVNNQLCSGLFASIGDDAKIEGITFDNITVSFNQSVKTDCSYGLLAGKISDVADISNVKVNSGKIIFNDDFCQNFKDKGSVVNLIATGSLTGITYDYDLITYEHKKDQNVGYSIEVDDDGDITFTYTAPPQD